MGAARFLQALARHGFAYVELFSGVVGEYRSAMGNRVSFAVAGLALGISGLIASWASLVIVLWDSSTRNAVAVAGALVLLLGAALCLWRAASRTPPSPLRSRLSRELKLDMELLQEWKRQNLL